jgi:hypothetical protein
VLHGRFGDDSGGENEVVGDEFVDDVRFRGAVFDPAKAFGIGGGGFRSNQTDGLIAEDSGLFVGCERFDDAKAGIVLQTSDEEGGCLMDAIANV